MRRHISLLAATIICFINTAFAQQPYFSYETKTRGESLSFPVFSRSGNTPATNKINRFLQLSELQILQGYEKVDIFEMIAGEDSNYDISCDIKQNTAQLLSVRFNLATCGATCYYWTNCYNFNAQTGDPVQLGDLLTAEGLEAFYAKATARWSTQMDAALKKQDANINEEMQQFKECFNDSPYTLLESFYVQGNDLYIDAENCLPKFAKFYDIDTAVRFSIKELTPYLNDYGRSIFKLSSKPLTAFKSELLKELIVFTNKDKSVVLAMVKGHQDYNEFFYADLKNNIREVFEGNYNTSVLKLADYDGKDKTAQLTATIKANEATVVYEYANGEKIPAVVLTRQ